MSCSPLVYGRAALAGSFTAGRRLLPLAVLLLAMESAAMAKTELGAREDRFTLNGRTAFLLGISYYGALGAPEPFVRRDLDDMRRAGINWIRVWATWNAFGEDVSAVDGQGRARDPYLMRLKALLEACDRRGMVVDVTLSRGKDQLQTLEAHRRAVETLIAALRPWRNWYLDLANERNIRDSRYVPKEELRALRARAREMAPRLLVTASQGGDIGREEAEAYLKTVGLDFLCPHRPRDAGSPAQTEAKTREYRAWMREAGRVAPLHYQEPFRRGYGDWEPTADDFLADLRGAIAGGAAGWCLHNGSERGKPDERPRRSFDLRERRLFDQLDAEERRAVDGLKGVLSSKA